ncbi:substrate-binding domain-containing protein [Paenibacillus sp. WQ 127069]|uniref:Substrate-binding domain-containing protein n=1 Tax=Paenibacillus baimaensis TaxID=2982185 RepID=A0ABT2URV8_9BACL|nr:substrate-binding domain-containing protein [Paenibacillus sp. WQ 127069]MCU6796791.1 substrate-binding domain-containing protein [Paenibacillus sp. WQ 127069]
MIPTDHSTSEDNKQSVQSRALDWTLIIFSLLGWGSITFVLYLVATIGTLVFTESSVASWLQTDNLSDGSLAVLLGAILSLVAAAFVSYGLFLAAVNKESVRWLAFASLPVLIVGVYLWYSCYLGSSPMDGFEGNTWFIYLIYVSWATPGFDYIRHYVPDGWMPFIGLSASFLPTLCGILGTSLYSITSSWSWSRLNTLISIIAIPCCMTLCFGVSLFIPSSAEFTPQSYPKVDGATAAIHLGQELAHQLEGMNRPKAERAVSFSTTHYAYVNLISKKADLILVAGPSDEEQLLAKESGVVLKLTPIGKDAFIFLVHHNNPIESLTIQQIQAIYAGTIHNWQEVGGNDEAITSFQREPNSGSQTYMETKVMKGHSLMTAAREHKITGMGGMIDKVAEYTNANNAIGYSFYYYANEMHRRQGVKFVKLNGVESNKDNIRNGSYPLTAVLYAVTRDEEPQDEPTSRMLSWLLSAKGAAAIEKSGFVPIQ